MTPARVGIFGGSFDPPHVGHLLVASDAAEALALDLIVFVPTATQPLKADRRPASAELRLAMTRALVGDDARFTVDPIEIDRGGLSFTVDTLAALAARWPVATRFLLAGADVLHTFPHWREPLRVRSLATLVVLTRATDAAATADAAALAAALPGGAPVLLPTRRVDVSSTEVRARIAAGRPVRGFVPAAVADLIQLAGLYR